MGVNVGGSADLRVPKGPRNDPELLAIFEQQGRVGVPEIVEPLPRKACDLKVPVEISKHVSSHEWSSLTSREDVAEVSPSRPSDKSFRQLSRAVLAKTLDYDAG